MTRRQRRTYTDEFKNKLFYSIIPKNQEKDFVGI